MISPYVSLLILAGLMVNGVSMKTGDSNPCHPNYRVKYLSKEFTWKNCSTEFPNDDKILRVFTVTVNNLTDKDANWECPMDKVESGEKKYFHLSVTKGMPSLYVDQQEIITFGRYSKCYNHNQKVTKWCRLCSSCVTLQTGSINEPRVTINSSVPNVFTVTMSELRTESSGWYSCEKGRFQMPVHVTVRELPSTTSTATNTNTAISAPATTQHSSLPTSAEPYTAHPTNSTINGTSGKSLPERNSSTEVIIITTTLVLLLLVGPSLVFFGWRMMMRCNKSKPEGSNINEGSQIGNDPDEHDYATVVHTQDAAAQQQKNTPEESGTYSTIEMKDSVQQMGSQIGNDPDEHDYATVVHTQDAAAQQQQKNTPEESGTYSTIEMKDSVQQMTEPEDRSMIYSTLTL